MTVSVSTIDGVTGRREFRVKDFGREPGFGYTYNVRRVREAEEIEFVDFGDPVATPIYSTHSH